VRNDPAVSAAPVPSGWSASRRIWLARAALLAMLLAVVVVVATEGFIGLTLMIIALVGAVLVLAGGYWFIGKHGLLRWIGLTLVIAALIFVIVAFIWQGVVAVALVSLALLALGGVAARAALRHSSPRWMPTQPATPAQHAFIVMNPHSGGGKVVEFDLKRKAEALGAEVFVMEGPGHVDIAALVLDAVGRGADLLGVAGGDGTQALVAGIAAEHDIPLLVISAGTRNHFALDLGLDRDDPSTCLDALVDGEDVRVDLGMIAGRPFVNNASFGAYAEVVQSPEYRDNKNSTMLAMLPDLLSGDRGAQLTLTCGGSTYSDEAAILVSNNPYGEGRLLDLGRRARLDQGELGVVTGRLGSTTDALSMLGPESSRPITFLSGGSEVVVSSDSAAIPVGIDGEAITVDTPVHCTIRPRALVVRLPKNRPGVPQQPPRIDWKALWRLASGHAEN
jgi:diacylglycerol kinase family enzyme